MTHHDTPIDRDTIEILHKSGKWSRYETQDPEWAEAFWKVTMSAPKGDIQWICWKVPSETRGYVAKATFGREPECPNCCAAGCPQASLGSLPGESIEAQTARIAAFDANAATGLIA
jgi:hypothetical protein